MSLTQNYIFTLGREWRLSLAELFARFGTSGYRYHDSRSAFFELPLPPDEMSSILRTLGGTIRIMQVISPTTRANFPTDILRAVGAPTMKYHFALGCYAREPMPLTEIGIRLKKSLQERQVSARLVNHEPGNLKSAVYKNERLAKSQSEWNYIEYEIDPEEENDTPPGAYLAVTLACQDIDDYTRRDTSKDRDMIVGMMPPKLTQILINLAVRGNPDIQSLYDPFCGLGTTLIEAANMGIPQLLGSDISPEMAKATEKSLGAFLENERTWQERIRIAGGTPRIDTRNIEHEIVTLDAKEVASFLSRHTSEGMVIVTEWYLGEIMMKQSITLERVQTERAKLARMYDRFLHGLKAERYRGIVAMTIPYWDIRGTPSYFWEFYELLEKYGATITDPTPARLRLTTRKGSFLYKRPGQNVGREVICFHF